MRMSRALPAALALACLAASAAAQAAAQAAPRVGPTFGAELAAAGCAAGIAWTSDGTLTFSPGSDPACAQRVLAAHDPAKQPVPASVSRLQGRLALSHAGLLASAEGAVAAAGGDLPIWYADAATWERNDPHVIALGATLNLAPAQIDALFIQAAAF